MTPEQLRAVALLWDAASAYIEDDQENAYVEAGGDRDVSEDPPPGPLLAAVLAMQDAFKSDHPLYFALDESEGGKP